jgi:hypothetical protein
MKRLKVPGGKYKVFVPKDTAWRIETPPDQIRMHALVFAVAMRGGGKTVALTSLLRSLQKDGCLDRLLVVTPTWGSNKLMYDGLPIAEEDVYHEAHPNIIDDIVAKVQKEMDDYTVYTEKMKLRKQLLLALKACHSESDVYRVNPQLMLDCFNYDIVGQDPPPHKWGGRRPVMALMIDDAQGSKLFNSAKFSSLCLRHRHLGDGLGISILMAGQTYKSQQGGMPVAIRDNMTHMLLFPSRNKNALLKVIEETSDDIDEDTFLAAFEEATRENEHDFLFLDFKPKQPHQRFRHNFDEYLVFDGSGARDPGQTRADAAQGGVADKDAARSDPRVVPSRRR